MSLITIAAVAVIAATIAVFVDRRIIANKQKAALPSPDDAMQEEGEALQAVAEKTEKKSLISNIPVPSLGKKQIPVEQFKHWVEEHVADATLKEWLLNLSPDATKALSAQLADFCADLNCNFHWLLDGQMKDDPEIERVAKDVIINYCSSCQRAAEGYASFELFKIIGDIQEKPFSKPLRSISRRLFTELVKEGLAPAVPAELFVSSEKERQDHMHQAIVQVASSDREAFKRCLREAIVAEHSAHEQASANGQNRQNVHAPEQDSDETEHKEEKKQRRIFGGGKKSRKAATEDETADAAPQSAAETTVVG